MAKKQGVNWGGKQVYSGTVFVDNSTEVQAQMDVNVTRALEALGVAAVGLIVNNMQMGYRTPIRDTGSLMRDVQYHVSINEKTTAVGNTLHYGPYVHDGTRYITGRPYITDGLTKPSAKMRLKTVAGAYLQEGFDG